MTIEDKARELVNKFFSDLQSGVDLHLIGKRKAHAKRCALITVEEMLNELTEVEFNYDLNLTELMNYWKNVKTEIEKL